jgi:hypothetical protein
MRPLQALQQSPLPLVLVATGISDASPRVLTGMGLNPADQQGHTNENRHANDHDHEVHQSPPIATGRHADQVAGCGTPQVYFAANDLPLQS